ncbi:MAG TPA: hypothetical protein VMF56_00215 [Acidobacteriaceae bacterium]|nr:hypothetical protein [Acidobacteriaceae bacterium]
MSAIQPIDVAAPNRAMPVPVTSRPEVAEPGQPFAEVMQSAVSPTQMPQTAQKTSYPSNASASSRSQFNRFIMSAGANSNRAEESASASSSQAANGNATVQTANLQRQDSDSSNSVASSAVPDGDASSLADGQTHSPIQVADVGDRSSEVTEQRVHADDNETGSSPALNGRKPTSSVKAANGHQDASGVPAVTTTASLAVASVSAILPNLPIVSLPTASSAATESKSGTKLNDASTLTDDSSFSNRATTPNLTVPTPQKDGTTDAVAMQPHGAGVSTDGILVSEHSATAHGAQTSDERSYVNLNSNATHNGISTGDAGANQPAVVGDGGSTQARTNGSANIAGDATSSNTVSANGVGNSGTAGNDPVSSGGNGVATSIHDSNGSKSSSFTAAMPPTGMAAKDIPGQQANPVGSSAGMQNSSSIVSSAGHFGTPGSFPSSTVGSTAARATSADAFTALDSAAAGERGVLLHAAPHQVSVGVTDPSLGWVEVRAERVSGQIAAALTTSSAASHAALTSVLPTMATYLQEHHAGVQQVHVESSLTGGQAGTGSQGQTASQNEAQTSSNSAAVVSSSSSDWKAAPITRAAIPASQGTNSLYEGHHFSIRA